MDAKFYFVTWIFVSYLLIGVTSNLLCKVFELTGDVLQVCDMTIFTPCCRWNPETGKKEICCVKGLGDQGKCPREFDISTCEIPTCFEVNSPEDCNVEFFETQVGAIGFGDRGNLPAGVTSVSACCAIEADLFPYKCCINVGKKTKCDAGYATDKC